MKPYYNEGGITIYHGDCREVLPEIDSIEIVVTDPPYGMNYHSGHYVAGNPHKRIEGDDSYPVDVLETLRKAAKIGVIAFCRWDCLSYLPVPDSCIAWVKNNWTAGDLNHDYARQWEAVAVYNGANHVFANGRPSDVVHVDRVPPTQLLHPTEKPVALIQKLLSNYSYDCVLDPYMGCGTTLVAAKADGKRGVGIELEERYCEVAARRLAQGVFEFDKPGSPA